jgi:hypothetical protein
MWIPNFDGKDLERRDGGVERIVLILNLVKLLRGSKLDLNISQGCPMTGFDTCGVELSDIIQYQSELLEQMPSLSLRGKLFTIH